MLVLRPLFHSRYKPPAQETVIQDPACILPENADPTTDRRVFIESGTLHVSLLRHAYRLHCRELGCYTRSGLPLCPAHPAGMAFSRR